MRWSIVVAVVVLGVCLGSYSLARWRGWIEDDPGWFQVTGLSLVIATLVLVAGQLWIANRQIEESQHLAAAAATLDFIDRAVDTCLNSDSGWSGSKRVWRLKGEMIDHLRDGDWEQVNLVYRGDVDEDDAEAEDTPHYTEDSLKGAICEDFRDSLPLIAVNPEGIDFTDLSA